MTGQLAYFLIDPEHAARRVDLDEPGADMLVSRSQPGVARAHPILRARFGTVDGAAAAFVEAVDCACNLAVLAVDRGNVHLGPDMGPIRPFEAALHAAQW